VPNLSLSSGGSRISSSKAHLPTSARSRVPALRPGYPASYTRRPAEGPAECLAFLLPFGHQHSLLGHPVPPGNSAPLTIGLPARHPCTGRTLTRFPCSARVRHDWGRASSLPRGRRCPHDQGASLTAACRLSTAGPCHPVHHPVTGRSLDEASTEDSLAFTPCPVFPWPVTPGRNEGPWAFP
jgi:hypothetical protein